MYLKLACCAPFPVRLSMVQAIHSTQLHLAEWADAVKPGTAFCFRRRCCETAYDEREIQAVSPQVVLRPVRAKRSLRGVLRSQRCRALRPQPDADWRPRQERECGGRPQRSS